MNSIKFLCFCLAAMLLLSIGGCKNKSSSPQDITLSVLESSGKDTSQVSALKIDDLNGYFGIDAETLKDFSVYICASNESAFEVGAFTVKKDSDRNALVDGINNHCNSVATSFRVINEAAYKAVQRHLLMQLGDTVIYVISDKYAEAEKALQKLGAVEMN